MICLKCKRRIGKDERCYVFESVVVVGYQVYEKVAHKATICEGYWKGGSGK